MPLENKILDKIREIYKLIDSVPKYWAKIESSICKEYKKFSLNIAIYTYVDEKIAYFINKEIQLNKITAEAELDFIIKNIKELINPNANEND